MTSDEAPLTDRPYEQRELRSAPSLVLVNTGDGKGKSTAAFGTILRALAQGWPVAVVQFLKSGDWHTGEEEDLPQPRCGVVLGGRRVHLGFR